LFSTLILFFQILGNSKKYYTFSTDTEKKSFVPIAQMPSKRENYDFFPGRKGLQQELATLDRIVV
jgi:hypothetical protein